ncbi:MAG: helix-turn-helix domain-containing protein [Ruminococcaceae bacterium]|nr:helix-turn-helix domain-containing protein [Oscillospiraceae bacterium]
MKLFTSSFHIPQGSISASEKREFEGGAVPHIHEFFELEMILGGTGEAFINGVSYPLTENTVFLLTPAHIHEARLENTTLINVMFQGNVADAMMALAIQDIPVFRLTDEEAAFVRPLLKEIVDVHRDDPLYAVRLLHCVLEKLARCQNAVKADAPPLLQRAVMYTLEHFREELTVTQVARFLGLSRAYFSDLFRHEFGVPYKEYLDSLRFSHVCTALSFSDLPIRTAAENAGFRDYANFTRRFKDKFGCTPREWRAK